MMQALAAQNERGAGSTEIALNSCGHDRLIVRADFARRIELPGAGPCARPVDIDRARTGFETLVSLRVYSFRQGMVIDGEAEGDEVFIVLMRGAADVIVSRHGREVGCFSLAASGGTRAIYMSPNTSYRLHAGRDCDVGYARGVPGNQAMPSVRGFDATAGRLEVNGYAQSMSLTLATAGAGHHLLWYNEPAPERFVHVRSDDQGTARIGGDQLRDWDAAARAEGDGTEMVIEAGTMEILTIGATRTGSTNVRA